MTNLGKWSSTTLTTVMSTELNSLANGSSVSTLGNTGPYDNTSNLNVYADIEVNLASLSPTSGATISLFILSSVDGSNYPAQSTSDVQLTSTQLLTTIPIGITASTAQRIPVRQVVIPPTKFQIVLLNNSGVALASSGNTVKFLSYSVNLNG
jgi:hypothetical protein